MDKNTITGLVLIGILLVVFSFLNRPTPEQLAAQQHYYDSIAQVQQREAELKAKAEQALAHNRKMQPTMLPPRSSFRHVRVRKS